MNEVNVDEQLAPRRSAVGCVTPGNEAGPRYYAKFACLAARSSHFSYGAAPGGRGFWIDASVGPACNLVRRGKCPLARQVLLELVNAQPGAHLAVGNMERRVTVPADEGEV